MIEQERHEAAAVDGLHRGLRGGHIDAGHLQDGAVKIHRMDQRSAFAIRSHHTRTTDEQRHTHAAFIERVLRVAIAERRLDHLIRCPIVTDEDDPRVCPHRRAHASQQSADLRVHGLHGGVVMGALIGSGVVDRQRGPVADGRVVGVEVIRRLMERGVRSVVGHPGEPRIAAACADPCQRIVRHIRGGIGGGAVRCAGDAIDRFRPRRVSASAATAADE